MATWIFLIVFPLFLGAPVTVTVETVGAVHCERVRKIIVKQLEDARSTAIVQECHLSNPPVTP